MSDRTAASGLEPSSRAPQPPASQASIASPARLRTIDRFGARRLHTRGRVQPQPLAHPLHRLSRPDARPRGALAQDGIDALGRARQLFGARLDRSRSWSTPSSSHFLQSMQPIPADVHPARTSAWRASSEKNLCSV